MRATLEQGLPALGLGPELIEPLETFSRMLLEKNQVMNLTAITDPRDVAVLHLLDSLALTGLAGLEDRTVVDVGTGAGFPGVPLAIARPSARVTLLDSLGKRVDFLRESCRTLGLDNVECVHGRAEEFAGERRETFDLAVSRAVAALPVLCELCLPLVKVGGAFWAMKSVDTGEELGASGRAASLLGGRLEKPLDYVISGTSIPRRLAILTKIGETPKKYPRTFAKIKKNPL